MGTPASTAVQLTEHRDPRFLWPMLGVFSVGFHLLLLGLMGFVKLEVQATVSGKGTPIPIQLVGEASESPDQGASNSREPTIPQSQEPLPPQTTSAAPTEAALPNNNSQSSAENGQPAGNEQPAGEASSSDASAQTNAPVGSPVAPSGPSGAMGSAAPPSTNNGPTTAGPLLGGSNSHSGQLMPLSIVVDPNGRDLPDTLPQLPADTSLLIQPYLSGCGGNNLSGLAASMPTVTVQLRITVEADGQISQATVTRGSGDANIDTLVRCLVERGVHLTPATTGGVAQPTDAVLLDTRLEL